MIAQKQDLESMCHYRISFRQIETSPAAWLLYTFISKVTAVHPALQMLPGCNLASSFLPGVCVSLCACVFFYYYCCFFPTHKTPPYRFHSNAITEMTTFSRCYHSWLSSVHIWRLSSSQECSSLQQIVNYVAGVGVWAHMVQGGGQPFVMHYGSTDQTVPCSIRLCCEDNVWKSNRKWKHFFFCFILLHWNHIQLLLGTYLQKRPFTGRKC